ncbi:MAG: DUF2452 domain-containing protein [Runella slithyformis]|nr:MAG: DUF2452 domain-containing protein [Runella slithyformis]TAG18783.1 MAG: DUF2452 domain-containing protein [Cytophagales bacterium]TAG40397.1 MAG: DUF2452 domain-containing protein [Cytophagia bacterium]TAF23804.1 MAG: DUF2452 domain-containing protein [Runella slithyformis]TAG50452.1 MAG: DUF2452 domain-containing protein [Runella slithyformis]
MQEIIHNPINPDKVAENPGLMAYAHSAGGAVIRPEDMGKVKGKSVLAMRQQSERQLNQVYQQMAVLAQQAKALRQRVEVSERIYRVNMNFEPIINETYYVYEKENGSDVLSMVAPNEWGRSYKFSRFIAQVTLLADHTWEVLYNEEFE